MEVLRGNYFPFKRISTVFLIIAGYLRPPAPAKSSKYILSCTLIFHFSCAFMFHFSKSNANIRARGFNLLYPRIVEYFFTSKLFQDCQIFGTALFYLNRLYISIIAKIQGGNATRNITTFHSIPIPRSFPAR